MKKEEILEKSRKSGIDERKIYIEERALTVSVWAVVLSIGFFMIVRVIHELLIYDLLSILFAYLTVNYFYKFFQDKRKLWFFLGILFAAATITYGVLYILSIGR